MKNVSIQYYKHNKDVIPAHFSFQKINYYELTICLHGKLSYVVNDKNYLLTDGDIIFIQPNSIRSRKHTIENSDYISFNFFCDDTVYLPDYIENGASNIIKMLIDAIDNIRDKEYHNDEIILLLQCIIVNIQNNLKKNNINPYVKKIIKFLHQNVDKRLTLKEIASFVSLSQNYADALFSKEIGKYIFDYFGDIKIQEAKKQIIENAKKLNEIAINLGFENYNYFSRYFKKKTGLSPQNFKKSFYK
jgi:YesN/AraC family two-component response regulator